MADPALLDRIDACIRELQEIRAAVAAEKGCDTTLKTAAGGNGLDRESTVVRLRAAAVASGARISGDDRVGEPCAAKLLGVEPGTLSRRRIEGRAPPSYKVPVGGSRISYKLADLSAWLAAHREDF